MAEEKKGDQGGGKGSHGGKGGHKKHGGGGGGGHGEEVNLERWLVSYADFMTLLFCLFVVLYAMSIVDKKKVQSFAKGFTEALGASNDPSDSGYIEFNQGGTFDGKRDMLDNAGREILEDFKRKRVAQDDVPLVNLLSLADYIAEILRKNFSEEKANAIRVELVRGIHVKMKWPDQYLFKPGTFEIDDVNYKALSEIAAVIYRDKLKVTLEGVSGIGSISDKRTWDDGHERASAVLSYFIDETKTSPELFTISSRAWKKEGHQEDGGLTNFIFVSDSPAVE